MSFAQVRKVRPSTGKTFQVCATWSIHASISAALSGSCSRVSSTPACSSPRGDGREVEILVGGLLQPRHDGAVRPRPAQLRNDVRIEEVHERSLERRGCPPAPASARRYRDLGSRRRGEQQILESGPRRLLQLPPLLDRHQHRRLHSSPGDDLGSLREARLQQLAEARFRVLHRPTSDSSFPSHAPLLGPLQIEASHLTSPLEISMVARAKGGQEAKESCAWPLARFRGIGFSAPGAR